MSEDEAKTGGPFVRDFDSQGAAEAIQAMLKTEGVPSSVRATATLCAVASRFRLTVEPDMAHRARWFFSQSEFSDGELTFLATGELDPEE